MEHKPNNTNSYKIISNKSKLETITEEKNFFDQTRAQAKNLLARREKFFNNATKKNISFFVSTSPFITEGEFNEFLRLIEKIEPYALQKRIDQLSEAKRKFTDKQYNILLEGQYIRIAGERETFPPDSPDYRIHDHVSRILLFLLFASQLVTPTQMANITLKYPTLKRLMVNHPITLRNAFRGTCFALFSKDNDFYFNQTSMNAWIIELKESMEKNFEEYSKDLLVFLTKVCSDRDTVPEMYKDYNYLIQNTAENILLTISPKKVRLFFEKNQLIFENLKPSLREDQITALKKIINPEISSFDCFNDKLSQISDQPYSHEHIKLIRSRIVDIQEEAIKYTNEFFQFLITICDKRDVFLKEKRTPIYYNFAIRFITERILLKTMPPQKIRTYSKKDELYKKLKGNTEDPTLTFAQETALEKIYSDNDIVCDWIYDPQSLKKKLHPLALKNWSLSTKKFLFYQKEISNHLIIASNKYSIKPTFISGYLEDILLRRNKTTPKTFEYKLYNKFIGEFLLNLIKSFNENELEEIIQPLTKKKLFSRYELESLILEYFFNNEKTRNSSLKKITDIIQKYLHTPDFSKQRILIENLKKTYVYRDNYLASLLKILKNLLDKRNNQYFYRDVYTLFIQEVIDTIHNEFTADELISLEPSDSEILETNLSKPFKQIETLILGNVFNVQIKKPESDEAEITTIIQQYVNTPNFSKIEEFLEIHAVNNPMFLSSTYAEFEKFLELTPSAQAKKYFVPSHLKIKEEKEEKKLNEKKQEGQGNLPEPQRKKSTPSRSTFFVNNGMKPAFDSGDHEENEIAATVPETTLNANANISICATNCRPASQNLIQLFPSVVPPV